MPALRSRSTPFRCTFGWKYARLGLILTALSAISRDSIAFAQPPTRKSVPTPSASPSSAKPNTAKAPESSPPPPAATPAADPTRQPASLPGEVGPPLYLLKDKQGQLQAVPGFKFEDFIELYRLKNRLAGTEERPRYVISHAMLTGSTRGTVVAMSALLTIELNDTNWVRIPLGFANSIVEGDPKLEGDGEVLLEFADPSSADRGVAPASLTIEHTGYVLWLRAEAKGTLKVTIPLVTTVATVGGETQLRIDAPRASVAQLVVEVPIAGALARVSDAATLLEPQVAPNKTTFSVLGASGPVELAWRSPGSAVAVTPAVLEASGMIWARIDGRSVGYEAKISVRSFGGQFDTFRVRLPPGAQLTGNSQPGVSVVPLPIDEKEKTAGPIVEVRLDKKASGPVEVRLLADRPRAADLVDEQLELAGFEILGAVRQWGNLGVQVAGNWQVVWGESRGMRQIDEVPEDLRREDLVGAFEYSSQPCSLTARVAPRRTRVSVLPQYVLTISSHETRLSAVLKYTIRGAKVRALSLEMPGWEIDEIGPPNVVNVEAAAIEDATRFSIPLAQPLNGDLTLSITARRRMPTAEPGSTQLLEFDLPKPQAEVVAPGVVVIQPEDNIELTPRGDGLSGLSLRSTRPQVKLAQYQQDPLCYQADGAAARFQADSQVNSQQIVSSIESRLDLDERELQIEERLRYEVLYEPVEKLILRVPRTVALDRLEVSLDGARLTPIPLREDVPAEPKETVRVSIPLGGSRIGRCELVVAYRVAQEKLPPASSVPVSAPLVMPAEGTVKQNVAFVRAEAGISVSPRKGVWNIDDRIHGNGARQDGIWLTAIEPADSIGLAVTLEDRSREGSTLVEQGWIQTWLTENGRQDRAVYRLSTSERKLRISLPPSVNSTAVQAKLDGKSQSLEADPKGGVVLVLANNGQQQQHLLELNYHLTKREPVGSMVIEPARLLPSVWTRRVYWQLILPGHEHLLFSPGGLTNESLWEWTGYYWRRSPTLASVDLENWIGSTDAVATPPAAANCYLFSSVGAFPTLELRTVRRASLIFTASFAVLCVGLALMYLPWLRHPGMLFAAAVAVLALSLLMPDISVLIGQSALLGTVLVLLALLLAKYTVPSPIDVPVAPRTIEESADDRSSTDLYYRAPSEEGPPSTATAPLVLPRTGAETA